MSYPRWITEPDDTMNLREVAPHLYVGAETSPMRGGWHTIIDFYGHAPSRVHPAYNSAKRYLKLPFEDGSAFPHGALDQAWAAWHAADLEGGETLLHCQAGLSRSASAAYAFMLMQYWLSPHEALKRVTVRGYEGTYPMERTLRSAAAWARGNNK
jgi:predicted protein tyrosine phosphatase